MSEQEFIDGLKKAGLNETEIEEFLGAFHELTGDYPELTLNEWFDRAVKTHNETKGVPENNISF
jgi:hypothetical protein